MAVLLIAEVNGAELALDATSKALTAAKQMGDVTILCASAGCSGAAQAAACLLYTSPSPRDFEASRMPSSA